MTGGAPRAGVTRPAQAVFACLVVATFGAFFVAQRLKHGPTLIQNFGRTPIFSPNSDGRFDRAKITFLIKHRDDVTVDVVDTKGDRVRRLADNRTLPSYKAIYLKWDGTTDDGGQAPDGIYRARVTLREEGRSIVVPKSFRKDTKPPAVKVASIGPFSNPGPELLPGEKPAVVHFTTSGRRRLVRVFRTSPGPVTEVLTEQLGDTATSWPWDGRVDGKRVRAGTYLVEVEARDSAGNIGTSVPVGRPPARLPRIPYGERLPGRGGITVRYLGVQPPLAPLPAGRSAQIAYDARGEPVTWSLRRVGRPPQPIRRGSAARPPLKVPIPRGESGVYLLSVRTAGHQQRVPLVTRASKRHRVLVVLPWLTWMGRNPLDDDGDGAVNTLARGVSSLIDRVLVGDGSGLPVGFAHQEAPVLAWLDREHHRYDLTTDAALAEGVGPRRLDRYKGILLAGEEHWIPRSLGTRLRRFVRGGGTVASLGVTSLRALVGISKGGRAIDPTALSDEDVFGARLRPVVRGRPVPLTALTPDEVQLFAGTAGELTGYDTFEVTGSVGDQATQVSAAVTPAGRPVVVAARFGRGLVIRTGLPQLPSRLSQDGTTRQVMERTWTLLSR